MSEEITAGTLRAGEIHPSAKTAMAWIERHPIKELLILHEALASTALSGNRTADVCSETLGRILSGAPVSDRYLLGLAWFLRDMEEATK